MLLDYRMAQYLMGVEGALEEERVPVKYLTNICPECGEAIVTHLQAVDGFHVVSKVQDSYYVVIGCEGYWVIDPKVVGLTSDNWQDWTVDPSAALGDPI